MFFSGNINGTYGPTLSNGYTKYLISIGGSNASAAGWLTFLNNPVNTANLLYPAMMARGIIGLDFDLEGTSADNQNNIKILVSELKKKNSNVIIMYTILLGSPGTFSNLINDNQMDFVSLMLYNGGMYVANGSGAGCDWDQWAEMFLSGCTACNCQPLMESCSAYCQQIGNIANYKNKVVLGVITDAASHPVTSDQIVRAMDLCSKYGGAGILFWVLPGWASKCSQKNVCQEFLSVMQNHNPITNNYFDVPASCPLVCPSTQPGCCPKAQNGCQSCTGNCIATQCGVKNNITNEQCAACAQGKQTWWPCNLQGVCQCDRASSPDNLPGCPSNTDPCPGPTPSPTPGPTPSPTPIPVPIPTPTPPVCPVCPTPTPTPTPTPIPPNGRIYVSIRPNVSNQWCQTNCTYNPPFCPPEYCILQN